MGPAFLPNQKLKANHGMDIMADMEVMEAGVAGLMDANVVKQTPMQLQSQKLMPGMAMDTIHTTLDTTILAKEKLKLKLSHNHGDMQEDMAMAIGDANAEKPKLTASHIII